MGLYYIHRLVRMGLVVSMALAATACTETQFLAAQWKEHQPPSNSQGLFKVGKPILLLEPRIAQAKAIPMTKQGSHRGMGLAPRQKHRQRRRI